MLSRFGLGNARNALAPFVEKGFGRLLALVGAAGAVIGLLEAALLRIIGSLVGSLESNDTTLGPFEDVGIGALVATGLVGTLVLIGLRVIETGLIARVGVIPLTAARRQLARAFLSADYSSQQRMTSGEYQELITAHTMRLGSIATATATFVSAGVIALALAVVAAFVSLPALVVLIGVMALVFLTTVPIQRLSQRLGRSQADENTQLAKTTAEMVEAATAARVFGVEAALEADNAKQVDETSDLIFKSHAVGFFGSSLFQALMLGVTVGIGGWFAARSTGDFATAGTVALIAMRAQMAGRRALTAKLSIATSAPFADDLHATIATFRNAATTAGSETVGPITEVELSNVHFSHEGHAPNLFPNDGGPAPVLRGVDLVLAKGEHVGIVGASGSGKSTLLSIVLGLRAPTQGSLRFNGIDRTDCSAASLGMQIASVAQRPSLVSGSVQMNIAFHRSIELAQVVDAAKAAGIHDEILSWPDGYDTVIGERGGRQVSGGQAQRICIARALAGEPTLLVMDEPTSAIDEAGSQLIADTMSALDSSCAALIVSHRPEALASCDRILTMVDGCLMAASS